MYCRSRPQYRSDLGWISGVAFLGTLTRSARPVQGFTFVRCCSMPPASSPHGLAAPGLGRLTTAIPACSCLQLAVATNSLRRGLSPPIQCPCLAHQGQALRVAAKSAAILDRHSTRWRSRTAVGAEEWLRRGQTKEWAQKQVSCQDIVITIREGRHQFSWHKNRNNRGFPHQTPW